MALPEIERRERPAIRILVDSSRWEDPALYEVKWGIEEEGVPEAAEQAEASPRDAIALAHQAALASRLGVGVSLAEDGQLVLHYFRLPPEKPLFRVHIAREGPEVARVLGNNAARLVKGIPFKPLEEDEADVEELRLRWEARQQQRRQGNGPGAVPKQAEATNQTSTAEINENELKETVREVVARVLGNMEGRD